MTKGDPEIEVRAWIVLVVSALLLALSALIAVGVASGQQLYCHESTGCYPLPLPPGMTCSGTVDTVACPAATPTPTPTVAPTATPTPGEPQPAYTVTQFLAPHDLGPTYTYLQAPRLLVLPGHTYLTLNGGDCCPGIGDGIGECSVFVDYSTAAPWWGELFCTYRDTPDLWETSGGAMALDYRGLQLWGDTDYRPAVSVQQSEWKDSWLWHRELAYPVQSQNISPGPGSVQRFAGWWPDRMLLPQGLLRLGGQDYLYAMSFQGPGMQYTRFAVDSGLPMERPLPPGQPLVQPLFSGIAIDADGSLIATTDDEPPAATTTAARMNARAAGMTAHAQWWPSQNGGTVRVWRSRDAGVTWKQTGITFAAPKGRALFGCAFATANWGAALQPWLLVCSIGTGQGPDVGDWGLAYIATAGAKVPANLGAKPAPNAATLQIRK